uniref:Hsp20/alpha crystallin family protein n=1 Tax=Prevotella sp. GTC17260 TaxID=3236796 RepID=A0AB33J6S4_9BACT
MMYRNSWLPVVFNDFFNNVDMPKANATAPAINVKESDVRYTVELAAPGLRKEDFDVNINADGDLTIKMENKRNVKEEKEHYLRREFSYAKYEQTLILPEDVDKEKIAARVNDGVLTVDLPKVKHEEQKIARQIEIG